MLLRTLLKKINLSLVNNETVVGARKLKTLYTPCNNQIPVCPVMTMKLNCNKSKIISFDPQMLGARLVPKKTADFFRTLVRDSIRFREREGIIRPDMIHLLMQVGQNDVQEDGISSSKNPELENTSLQDNTRNTNMSKTWCISLEGLAVPSSPQAYTTLCNF
jgi:hypothetical protein